MGSVTVPIGNRNCLFDIEDFLQYGSIPMQINKNGNGDPFIIFAHRSNKTYENKVVARVIMNANSDILIDHWNGNGLDCRKENLRTATYQQNSFNRKGHSNYGLPKGITSYKLKSGIIMYRVTITKDGVKYSLGSYILLQHAELIYRKKEKEFHGDFAFSNRKV